MEFPVILKDGSIIGVDFCTALGFKEALEYNIIKNFSHRSNDQAFREELEKIIREVVEPKFRALLLENVQTRKSYFCSFLSFFACKANLQVTLHS